MNRLRVGLLTTALAGCVALLVSACASQGSSREAAPSSTQQVGSPPTAGDPLKLVGSWHLAAPGQQPGSVLRLGDDLTLWSSCGVLMGDWTADHAGLFVATVSGISGHCPVPASGGDPTPDWLTKVRAFKIVGTGVELLDGTGAVVARLTPGAHPTPGPDIASELANPPTMSADLQRALRPPAPLPAGLVPATSTTMLGRWGSADHPERRGFVELSADGSWRGSDGANGQGGRWSAGPDGAIAAVAGAQTLAGCVQDACVDVGGWLTDAARAGFDGRTLLLVDADGKVLGRLARAAAPSSPKPPPGSATVPVSSPAPAASSG